MSKVSHQRTNEHKDKNKSIMDGVIDMEPNDADIMASDHPAKECNEDKVKIGPG